MANQKITELEEQMALMQEEIERLKQEENESLSNINLFDKYKEQIEAARNEMFNTYGKIVDKEKIHSITTYVSVGRFTEDSNPSMLCTGTGMFSSFDDLNEDTLADVIDVFTNSHRISILKVLVKADMTASEISQCTGLQGGQLYRHLSILESAKLISKIADKYKADNKVQGILCGLFAVLGGIITRN